jgi:hypothetical protein
VAANSLVEGRIARLRDYAVLVGVAIVVFLLSYAGGGFATTTRAYAAIVAWWLLGIGAAVGLGAARSRAGRLPVVSVVLLALFALWTLLSLAWAPEQGAALAQFDQVSLYVAALVLAIVLGRVVSARILAGAVALALVGIAGVALVSRLFPSTFGAVAGTSILPALGVRLNFPVGYWNGLGIEVALAYPLLLALMSSRRSRLGAAVAALPLPLLGAVLYLTFSRGAFLTAAVGIVVFLLLSPSRWTALVAAALAAVAGAAAIAVLEPRKALVNGQETPLGIHQGHVAALAIGLACLVAAVVWLGLGELGKRLPPPPRVFGWGVVVLLVIAAIGALVAAHPVGRLHAFEQLPPPSRSGTSIENHLLSTSGSGRWQFWSVAVTEFKAHPLNGGGAGSWGSWWLEHAPFNGFSLYAHSLYLETLAELGIVGLLLLFGAIVTAVAGAIRSALAVRSAEVAAAAACGIAFFVAASFDWVWQLAGVAIVGVGALGIALGALPSGRPAALDRFGIARPLLAVAAVAAIVPQVVVLAMSLHLASSQAAVREGNLARARSQALSAKAVEPWAAAPYLQLALIDEKARNLSSASRWIADALDHSRRDWSIWLVAERIDTERGRISAARSELAQARRLNPWFFRSLSR